MTYFSGKETVFAGLEEGYGSVGWGWGVNEKNNIFPSLGKVFPFSIILPGEGGGSLLSETAGGYLSFYSIFSSTAFTQMVRTYHQLPSQYMYKVFSFVVVHLRYRLFSFQKNFYSSFSSTYRIHNKCIVTFHYIVSSYCTIGNVHCRN